jgi:hypothetical protein
LPRLEHQDADGGLYHGKDDCLYKTLLIITTNYYRNVLKTVRRQISGCTTCHSL